jgi:hypothetical protein
MRCKGGYRGKTEGRTMGGHRQLYSSKVARQRVLPIRVSDRAVGHSTVGSKLNLSSRCLMQVAPVPNNRRQVGGRHVHLQVKASQGRDGPGVRIMTLYRSWLWPFGASTAQGPVEERIRPAMASKEVERGSAGLQICRGRFSRLKRETRVAAPWTPKGEQLCVVVARGWGRTPLTG